MEITTDNLRCLSEALDVPPGYWCRFDENHFIVQNDKLSFCILDEDVANHTFDQVVSKAKLCLVYLKKSTESLMEDMRKLPKGSSK